MLVPMWLVNVMCGYGFCVFAPSAEVQRKVSFLERHVFTGAAHLGWGQSAGHRRMYPHYSRSTNFLGGGRLWSDSCWPSPVGRLPEKEPRSQCHRGRLEYGAGSVSGRRAFVLVALGGVCCPPSPHLCQDQPQTHSPAQDHVHKPERQVPGGLGPQGCEVPVVSVLLLELRLACCGSVQQFVTSRYRCCLKPQQLLTIRSR